MNIPLQTVSRKEVLLEGEHAARHLEEAGLEHDDAEHLLIRVELLHGFVCASLVKVHVDLETTESYG